MKNNLIGFIKTPYILYLILKGMWIYKTSTKEQKIKFNKWYLNSEIKKNVDKRKLNG